MRYYLDTEFNGFGGALISLALVRQDGASVSYVFGCDSPTSWVAEHVMPVLLSGEVSHGEGRIERGEAARDLARFLRDDPDPLIVADWPEDIRHLCELIVVGPGQVIGLPGLRFQWVRAAPEAVPLSGSVPHNAWWDAMALWTRMEGL